MQSENKLILGSEELSLDIRRFARFLVNWHYHSDSQPTYGGKETDAVTIVNLYMGIAVKCFFICILNNKN